MIGWIVGRPRQQWSTPRLLKLDHLTVIAPTLTEGVSHVQNCLDLDIPFGTHHDYMGTHNHRLRNRPVSTAFQSRSPDLK
ncbi:MAG TPA: VOC family protein [Dongiaceae bacterium]|nr:VOC family protein [Dongiaceae bacterium]